MTNKCILITAVPNEYKKWFISTKAKLGELGQPNSNEVVEKIWLDHVAKNDKSGIMKYIHHEDRGARTAIQFGNGNPKETLVLGVKENEDGTVSVATLDGVYTFANDSQVSQKTFKGQTVTMPIMKGISTQVAASISGFTIPFNVLSSQANAWASKYMLIGLAEKSGGVIGPLIKKAHVAAKKKSGMYARTVNLISEGYRDSEFIGKMRVTLGVSGDVDKVMLSDVANIAYNNARLTQEVLSTDLPKLDKRIQREVRKASDRKNLNMIFGRSGFMHLIDNSELMAEINKGTKDLDGLIDMIPANAKQVIEAKELKEYLLNGAVPESGVTHSNGSKSVEQLAALYALKEDGMWDTLVNLRSGNPELFVELLRLVGMVKSLHEVVHKGSRNSVGSGSGKVYSGYDGHGMMDVYENLHEYKIVDTKEVDELLNRDPRWKVVRAPTANTIGIVSRTATKGFQDGMGLNKDVIRNGVTLETAYVNEQLKKHGNDWLKENNVVSDVDNGYERYRIILNKKERETAGYMDNIAHTLYRTWVHNAQVVEIQTVQKIILENMTVTGESGVDEMEKVISRNNKSEPDKRKEVKPFIQTDLSYAELKEKYPEVYKRYEPVKNISTYGDMRDKVTFVRKDMADILLGHPTGNLISEDTSFGVTLNRIETVYRQLIQMLKLKLVVANPAKLAVDVVSNTTLLLGMDVSVSEVAKGYTQALRYSNEMSDLERELVSAKLKLAQEEVLQKDVSMYQREIDRIVEKIKRHPFNYAIENGFVQSLGTSMLVKEFDTISGLQKTIDDVVKLIVKDKNGNPTKMHEALVWAMNAGFSVDDILSSVSNMSKVKGTSFGHELEGIAERLAEKKRKDVVKSEEKRLGRKLTEAELSEIHKDADTVRYVSEFIAAPSSEVVRQGSRVMQMGDLMSKWTLFTHTLQKNLSDSGYKFEDADTMFANKKRVPKDVWDSNVKIASVLAVETFIDYRLNMPSEIKALSDIGVLMFPGFWIKAQRIIYNLIKYHPLNAGAGVLVSDLLGLSGGSIVDANLLNKIANGTAVSAGQNVLTPGVILLGV